MKIIMTKIQHSNLRLFLIIIFATTMLALPRFAHHTPDSEHYIALAQYFQEATERASLQTPYVYRPLVPFLAAYGPSNDLDFNFAAINLFCTIGAYFIFYFYLRLLFNSSTEVNVGLLLIIFSFPSFNYATGVLTDPAGILFLIAAAYLLAKKRFLFCSIVTSLGILTRETLLVVVLAFLIMYIMGNFFSELPPKYPLYSLLLVIPPLIVYIAIRQSFSDLSAYYWYPSLQRFIANITRPVSWVTLMATLLPPLMLIGLGYFHKKKHPFLSEMKQQVSPHNLRLLLSLSLACVGLIVYSIMTAFMSGRFIWPIYISLIPLAIISSRNTPIYQKLLSPIANFCFGNIDNQQP